MLTIIRGLPGSGKTSYAKKEWFGGALVLEGDQRFVDAEGNYKFDPSSENKNYLVDMLQTAFINKLKHVIVTTASGHASSIQKLVDVAKAYNHDYRVAWMDYNNGDTSRNVHNLPQETIESMKETWELYPGEDYMVLEDSGIRMSRTPPKWFTDMHSTSGDASVSIAVGSSSTNNFVTTDTESESALEESGDYFMFPYKDLRETEREMIGWVADLFYVYMSDDPIPCPDHEPGCLVRHSKLTTHVTKLTSGNWNKFLRHLRLEHTPDSYNIKVFKTVEAARYYACKVAREWSSTPDNRLSISQDIVFDQPEWAFPDIVEGVWA